MSEIYKLPETGEVSLSRDVVVDADDLQRFIAAGGTIHKRGFRLEVHDGSYVVYAARKDVPPPTSAAWGRAAEHYRRLVQERADEGTSVQLACLVLADYCAHRWIGDCGGPTLEMIMLAENTVGDSLDEVVAAELTKLTKGGAT